MYYKIIDNNKDNWILLLHCICSNMHIFDSYIKELSLTYNIILIDLPGHGRSAEIENFNLQEVSKEIIRMLNSKNIEKVDVWGISLGAIVANELEFMYPEKIRVMVLEGAAFGLKNKLYLIMFNIFNKLNFLIPSKLYINIFINLVIRGKNRKQVIKVINEHKKETNKKAIRLWLKIMNEEYKNNIYSKCNVNNKRVYIMGEYDKVFIDSINNNIEENSNNKIIILKDTCHLCHLERYIDIAKLTNS